MTISNRHTVVIVLLFNERCQKVFVENQKTFLTREIAPHETAQMAAQKIFNQFFDKKKIKASKGELIGFYAHKDQIHKESFFEVYVVFFSVDIKDEGDQWIMLNQLEKLSFDDLYRKAVDCLHLHHKELMDYKKLRGDF